MSRHSTLRAARTFHLYFGLFISPALLFFAFTGALQTFSLHETTTGSDYKPPRWAVVLGQIHKKQTSVVPVRKPRPAEKPSLSPPPDPKSAAANAAAPTQAAPPVPAPPKEVPPGDASRPRNHLPLKLFFLLVAVGLFTSTFTGIYMAYNFGRRKLLVTAILLAGIVVPPLLLPF